MKRTYYRLWWKIKPIQWKVQKFLFLSRIKIKGNISRNLIDPIQSYFRKRLKIGYKDEIKTPINRLFLYKSERNKGK